MTLIELSDRLHLTSTSIFRDGCIATNIVVDVPTIFDNIDPLQIALAYRNQSHPQSPTSSKRGESDIPTLQKQGTSTLRCKFMLNRDLRGCPS